ncbi:unnamed protein product [Discosporangium mesarthrocarpum]
MEGWVGADLGSMEGAQPTHLLSQDSERPRSSSAQLSAIRDVAAVAAPSPASARRITTEQGSRATDKGGVEVGAGEADYSQGGGSNGGITWEHKGGARGFGGADAGVGLARMENWERNGAGVAIGVQGPGRRGATGWEELGEEHSLKTLESDQSAKPYPLVIGQSQGSIKCLMPHEDQNIDLMTPSSSTAGGGSAAPGEAVLSVTTPPPQSPLPDTAPEHLGEVVDEAPTAATAPVTPPPALNALGPAPDPLRDMHGYLREFTRAVLAAMPQTQLSPLSEDSELLAANAVDRHVFSECYGAVFSQVAAVHGLQDRALRSRIRREAADRERSGLGPFASLCCPRALAALRAVGRARTSFDKLGCLVRSVEDMSEALPGGTEAATTDDVLWAMCRHLAAGPLPQPHAEVAFIEQFVRDEFWLLGREGYVLTSVEAALHILHDPEISREVFQDPGPGGHQGQGWGGMRQP